jgi:peroxiredoxin (alkyl hydroperoxide reductase subunit C)
MIATLEVGQAAPEFTLRGPGGQPISLSDYRGKKNVVVAFYPLAFSPVCSHQLPDIQKVLPRIEGHDTVVLGVSVDSHYANEAFAKKLGLSFPLLSDFKRETSEAYGMLIPEKLYSGRALFVIDKQGRIAYKDIAPTPAEVPATDPLIAALERLP